MLGEEVLSEELSLQEFLEDRQGRPCSGSAWLIHQRGTTHEKTLDCHVRGVEKARRHSLDEQRDRKAHKPLSNYLSR